MKRLCIAVNIPQSRIDFIPFHEFMVGSRYLHDCDIQSFYSIYIEARAWLTRPHMNRLRSFQNALVISDIAFTNAILTKARLDLVTAFKTTKAALNHPKVEAQLRKRLDETYSILIPRVVAHQQRCHAARIIFHSIKRAITNPYHPYAHIYHTKVFKNLSCK